MRDTKLLWHARVLRVAGWNALLTAAALALIVLTAEAWWRSTVPFAHTYLPMVFVPGVGAMMRPDTEARWTNKLDFWTVSRTNRLGFLDREPPSPQRARESCHIAVIGDSFVAAREVPIREKFHVVLEEMAAQELPQLDITTSAFGQTGTGQIGQLPFYDEYARHLRPRLVVLVFVPNDYIDNFPLWQLLRGGRPRPYVWATRADKEGFRLRPPEPVGQAPAPNRRLASIAVDRALHASLFLQWLNAKHTSLFQHELNIDAYPQRVERAKSLRRQPAYARLLDEWRPVSVGNFRTRPAGEEEEMPSFFALFREGNDSLFFQEALAFTAFGLDQFKERADRDGTALVILATHQLHYFGGGTFVRMSEVAAQRGIPVVDQGEYIHRQGARLRDAGWAHDEHWNAKGHRWAAEALLEYLKENQHVCG